MNAGLQTKLDALRRIVRDGGPALIAYSGGVDSALVMLVARQELGSRSLACIGVSPSYPKRELDDAVKLAREISVPFRLVDTRENADPNYAANPTNRCYFCKIELFNRLRELAAAEGWGVIYDGSHLDDVSDHVNGMKAGRERGVRSPLLEAGIRKSDVRGLGRELGLPVWDKPAMACLSSRVPHGTAITPELLRRIEAAEDVLVALGFRQFRVRHHGELARVELPAGDLDRGMECRGAMVAGIRAAGYRYVTLDLAGFREESPVENPSASLVSLGVLRA